jgi:AcrR family transcriptional regulator
MDQTPARSSAQRPEPAPSRRRLPAAARTPEILAAAFEEFAERGYGGARMAAVAQRAGIAKGLIYHYFPSKQALFEATIRARIEGTFAAAEAQVPIGGGSATEALRGLVALAYRRLREEGRERMLFRLIVAEAERFPELARFYRDEILARGTAIVRSLLGAGAASGEFRPVVAAMPGLAEAIIGPVVAASVWRIILGEAEAPDLGTQQAAHLDLLLAGLTAPG